MERAQKYRAALALASAVAVVMVAQPTLAQTAQHGPNQTPPQAATPAIPAQPGAAANPAPSPQPSAATQDILKFSQDGHNAIGDINAARIALFDGKPQLASSLIAKANDAVHKAELEAPTFSAQITESVQGKKLGTTSETVPAKMVPVDGQIALAEDFVPTPEKMAHVQNANEHLKNGEKQKALDELRLGNIDVNYKRVLDAAGFHLPAPRPSLKINGRTEVL